MRSSLNHQEYNHQKDRMDAGRREASSGIHFAPSGAMNNYGAKGTQGVAGAYGAKGTQGVAGAYGRTGSVQKAENLSGVNYTKKDKNTLTMAYGKEQLPENKALSFPSEIENQKNYMMLLSTTVSDEELGRLQKEGFDPGQMNPEEIVTVVDEIKEILAKSGTIVHGFNDDLDMETLEQITGSSISAQAIKSALEDYELSQNQETVAELQKGLEYCEALGREANTWSEGAYEEKKYLLENQMEPTLQNLYMAFHSAKGEQRQAEANYFADAYGYVGRKARAEEIEGLGTQLDAVIQKAGLPLEESIRQEARWILEEGMALTEENLLRLHELNQMSLAYEPKEAAAAVARALKDGLGPGEAILGQKETYWQRSQALVEEVRSFTLQDAVVAEKEKAFTLKEYMQIHRQGSLQQMQAQLPIYQQGEPKASANASVRQIYELQLKMTISSTAFLLRNGIEVDTLGLEELLSNINQVQQHRQEILFQQGDAKKNAAAAALFERTVQVTKELPQLPAAMLGKAALRREFSLEIVYQEGEALRARYEKAAQEYETLGTEVRRDLGDSIQKAFGHVDSILAELGLEGGEATAKAVRILGYNQMEITRESVLQVEEAYLSLARILEKLTPARVVDLIGEGRNPLDMTMDQLETFIDQHTPIDAEKEAVKFSQYFVQLQEKGVLTPEQEQSYIGIYRLLHQIAKRDTAALGDVLQQGREVTLQNLLTSARSYEKRGMEVSVDEAFGYLEQMVRSKASITEQIAKGFTSNELQHLSKHSAELMEDLGQQEISLTLDHLLGYQALKEAPEELYQNTFARDWKKRRELYEKVRAAFTDRESAQAACANLWDILEEDLQEAIFHENMEETKLYEIEEGASLEDGALDLRKLKSLKKQVGVARELSRQECYQLPVQFGQQVTTLQVRLVHAFGQQGKMQLDVTHEKVGQLRASFEMKGAFLEGYVLGNNQEILASLKEKSVSFRAELGEVLLQAGEQAVPGELHFVQTETFVNSAIGQKREMPLNKTYGKADEHNRQAKEQLQEGQERTIGTKSLYTAAKLFMNLLEEL